MKAISGSPPQGLIYSRTFGKTYHCEAIHLKHKIVGSIFMEKLFFDGKNCRTPKLNKIFELFPGNNRDLGKVKRGQVKSIFNLSPSAEREGFEPPIPFSMPVFKTGAFDHSAISPFDYLETDGKFIKPFRLNANFYSYFRYIFRPITHCLLRLYWVYRI